MPADETQIARLGNSADGESGKARKGMIVTRQCEGRKKTGEQCGKHALTGKRFCLWHEGKTAPDPPAWSPPVHAYCLESVLPQVAITGRSVEMTIALSEPSPPNPEAWGQTRPARKLLEMTFGGNDLYARTPELEALLREWINGSKEELRQLQGGWIEQEPGNYIIPGEIIDDARPIILGRLKSGPPPWPAPGETLPAPQENPVCIVIPSSLAQPTFYEADAAAQAISNGPTRKYWRELGAGDMALLFVLPECKVQVKLEKGEYLGWWGFDSTHTGLWRSLKEFCIPAVLTFYTSLALLLGSTGRVEVALDDIIHAIGISPRSTDERDRWRRKIWCWLLTFKEMRVIGARPGIWKDKLTNRIQNMTSDDPLLVVTGRKRPSAQPALDGSAPPLIVTLALGDWGLQFRGNRKILSDFGDVLRVAAIPAGKPSGAWAQSIGLALQQRWRELSKHALVSHDDQGGAPIARIPKMFTRRELLTLYPPTNPTVDEVLKSKNPERARAYWDAAVRILKRDAGVIGSYPESQFDAPEKWPRQGWVDAWLDEPLEIHPCEKDAKAAAEIAESARKARRKARAKKRTPALSPALPGD